MTSSHARGRVGCILNFWGGLPSFKKWAVDQNCCVYAWNWRGILGIAVGGRRNSDSHTAMLFPVWFLFSSADRPTLGWGAWVLPAGASQGLPRLTCSGPLAKTLGSCPGDTLILCTFTLLAPPAHPVAGLCFVPTPFLIHVYHILCDLICLKKDLVRIIGNIVAVSVFFLTL